MTSIVQKFDPFMKPNSATRAIYRLAVDHWCMSGLQFIAN
jgi:hypothetical protein